MDKARLSPVFWLWIPVAFMAIQLSFEIFMNGPFLAWIVSENGPVESLQALIMVGALFVSLSYFFSDIKKTPVLNVWFGLAAICSFYVAGEEISWGQHLLDWTTPENWAQINDQNETNLHNTSSWLDQKPRLVLEVGIVTGTLILPLLKKRGWLKLPKQIEILLPPIQLSVIAILVIAPKIFEKIFELFDIAIFARLSEIQELYMFYFVFIYLIMLKLFLKETESS